MNEVAAEPSKLRAALRAVPNRVAGAFRGAPVAVGAVVLLWALALATDSVLSISHRVEREFATGVMHIEDGRWWTPLTAGLWAPNFGGYVLATVLLLLIVVPVERKIGSAKLAAAAIVTQVGGACLGLGLAELVTLFDESWGFRLHLGTAVGPTTWIFGVALVASSQMGALWRRRVRVGLLALLITLALFGGQLQDVIRLAAVVVGLVVGPLLVGRSERGAHITGTRREGRVLVALVVAATALGPALAALSPHAVGPLAVLRELFRGTPYTAAEVAELCSEAPKSIDCRRGQIDLRLAGVGPTILSLMPSLFLLVLADGLRRGRRFAWWASVVAQIVLLGLSLFNFTIRFVEELDSESIFYGFEAANVYRTIVPFLTPLAVLIVLLFTHRFFDVVAPPRTYVRLAAVLAVTTLVFAVAYVLIGWALHAGFRPEATVGGLVADAPQRLLPPVYLQWLDPRFLPESALATLLFEWIGVLFWIVAAVAVLATFLAPAYGDETGATEQARKLLQASGGSPLSWMTTWRGNRYWFTPDGSGYVAYRVIGGVALTTGDPVGPAASRREAVIDFAEYAAASGWTPCFYSVTDDVMQVATELGWTSIQVAEETVLDLGGLAFTGKRFQDVRTALNKAKKEGVTAEWVSFGSAPRDIRDQIVAISEEWVADKDMPEMGFTLGGIDEVDDPQVRCLVAIDGDRRVHGVTSWLPVYRDGAVVGWTLDFMRRRGNGFRPAMEFLIASAALELAAEGVEFASLSGAPLAKVDQGDAVAAEQDSLTSALDRLLDVLGRTLEPVYGFRSLLAFKSKFQPRYVPMYMAFPDPAALPSIGNAIGRAYLPEVSFGQGMRLVRTLIDR